MSEEIALVQTLDFITPLVDDPYAYGQIAAANSLSDVFAMGGKVHNALNIVAYDNCHITSEMLKEILQGGSDKIKESGGILLGGHSVEDLEMKYGLSVTGLVHPQKFIRNNTIKEGHSLILTKPIGMGVITTAIKADMATDSTIKKAIKIMSHLNKQAAEIALKYKVCAMTDVTGFGLLGHLSEMLDPEQKLAIKVKTKEINVLPDSLELAALGLFPAGSYKNKDYFKDKILQMELIDPDLLMLLFDSQTSGGLLIAIPNELTENALVEINDSFEYRATVIGEIVANNKAQIILE